MRALARVDADTFTATLSGLDPDRGLDGARGAGAARSGRCPTAAGFARLRDDAERRATCAWCRRVLAALAASKPPAPPALIRARLTVARTSWRARPRRTALAELKATDAVPRSAGGLSRGGRGRDLRRARGHADGARRSSIRPAPRPLLEEALKDRTGRCACAPPIC